MRRLLSYSLKTVAFAIVLSICSAGCCNKAQSDTDVSASFDGSGCYYVVTFSEARPSPGLFRRSFEPKIFDYLWIIPIDSLSNGNVPIYPFVIDYDGRYEERGQYEYYWLDIINHPTKYTSTKEKKHSLKKRPLNEELDSLYRIVYSHRTRIQNYSYSFTNGNKHPFKVTVFVTPVKGDFKKTVSQFDNRVVYFSNDFEYQEALSHTDPLFKKMSNLFYLHIPYFAPLDEKPCLYFETSDINTGLSSGHLPDN